MARSLRCIDLFAGAGGMSAGFRTAGFDVVAALESIPAFAKTHELNFPEARVVVAKAQDLSASDFAAQASIKGSIDVIVGGPPCQTFSTIGAPKIQHVAGTGDIKADPRNYLFQSFLDYVEHFQPRLFVMENVPQLRTKFGGALFDRLVGLADKLGYETHISVLNAVEFGVPQHRKRLFIVGAAPSVRFRFPQGDRAAGVDTLFDRRTKPVRTVRDALADLPEIFDGCRLGDLPYSAEANSEYQTELRSSRGVVGNNVCRVSNDRAKRVFAHMKPGDRYMDLPAKVRKILPFREDIFHDRLKRLVPDEPSWTVLAHIGMDGYMYIHPWEDRTLSVREAARLQSFADDFQFSGNMREQYVQVGNAVPPMLAAAIAASAKEALH